MILKENFRFYHGKEVYWWVKEVNIILQLSIQRLEIWCVGSLMDTIYDSKINFRILPAQGGLLVGQGG